jgi:5-formyltetrahydrofolate cyclo-ligase
MLNKQEVRKKFMQKIKLDNPLDLQSKSELIINYLSNLPEFKNFKKIHCYISKDSEVNTSKILSNNSKNIFVPYLKNNKIKSSFFNKETALKKNKFGIFEPKNPITYEGSFDLIIIPGLAFDKNKNRIGYGKGYYDSFLSKKKCFKIGLCFSFQLFEKIPNEYHDVKMDMIITEEGIIR